MLESVREGLWNVSQAAEFLNSTPHGIYKLVERRRIPHVRIGRKILFAPAALRDWIEKHAVPPDESSTMTRACGPRVAVTQGKE